MRGATVVFVAKFAVFAYGIHGSKVQCGSGVMIGDRDVLRRKCVVYSVKQSGKLKEIIMSSISLKDRYWKADSKESIHKLKTAQTRLLASGSGENVLEWVR